MKVNSYEFALMTRFLELGKRYGLEPWQFSVDYDRATGDAFFVGGPAGREAGKSFDAMVEALGGCDQSGQLLHEEGRDMLEALDQAIQNAPRTWAR